jgi:hypothetical protein
LQKSPKQALNIGASALIRHQWYLSSRALARMMHGELALHDLASAGSQVSATDALGDDNAFRFGAARRQDN